MGDLCTSGKLDANPPATINALIANQHQVTLAYRHGCPFCEVAGHGGVVYFGLERCIGVQGTEWRQGIPVHAAILRRAWHRWEACCRSSGTNDIHCYISCLGFVEANVRRRRPIDGHRERAGRASRAILPDHSSTRPRAQDIWFQLRSWIVCACCQ